VVLDLPVDDRGDEHDESGDQALEREGWQDRDRGSEMGPDRRDEGRNEPAEGASRKAKATGSPTSGLMMTNPTASMAVRIRWE
jgi:hypothetical protein